MQFYIIIAALGAILSVIIAWLAKSNIYILAGLAPLFPTFAILAHILVYNNKGTAELKETIIFGCFSIVPYLAYLLSMYIFVEKKSLIICLSLSIIIWMVASLGMLKLWMLMRN